MEDKDSKDRNSPDFGNRKSIMIVDEKRNVREMLKKSQEKKKEREERSASDKDSGVGSEMKKEGISERDRDDGVIVIDHGRKQSSGAPGEGSRSSSSSTRSQSPVQSSAASTHSASAQSEKASEECSKRVSFDEDHNKEYEVMKDENKATPLGPREQVDGKAEYVKKSSLEDLGGAFVPPTLASSDAAADSEMIKERNEGNVVAEGWMWKKRRIFFCCWIQRYLVLTKEGVLKYYSIDGGKKAKGNWNMREATGIDQQEMSMDSWRPFRIIISFPSTSVLLGFDEEDIRNYWADTLNRDIQKR